MHIHSAMIDSYSNRFNKAMPQLDSKRILFYMIPFLALVCFTSSSAQAALESRLGGKAYYDTVLKITWYADANAAAGTTWDDGLLNTDGWLTWASAADWVANLKVEGIGGWRMANMDVNGDQSVVDCSFATEQECRDNEYGYMFHQNGITGASPGPFTGTLQAYGYWADTLYQQLPDTAWLLTFGLGIQHPLGKASDRHVWAVRDGDIEDQDGDGVIDALDNCPAKINNDQTDKDHNGVGDACEPPQVSGFWPGNGPLGESLSVFIFGDYFDTSAGGTQVFVNGSRQFLVQVISADMMIMRTIVTESSAGPVAVITDNGSADAPVEFGQHGNGLEITGLWPSRASVGELVFISGNGLDPSPGATEVRVGTTLASYVQVLDANMILFYVPSGSVSAPVYVTTTEGMARSTGQLEVLP